MTLRLSEPSRGDSISAFSWVVETADARLELSEKDASNSAFLRGWDKETEAKSSSGSSGPPTDAELSESSGPSTGAFGLVGENSGDVGAEQSELLGVKFKSFVFSPAALGQSKVEQFVRAKGRRWYTRGVRVSVLRSN
jgi:hypothetical protein